MRDVVIWGILMVVGLVPFTLLGGWGPAGDESVWPWLIGFGTQAAFVAGYVLTRRWGGKHAQSTDHDGGRRGGWGGIREPSA